MPESPHALQAPSGHVFRVERKRGPVWYAKYRLPDGRQVQRKIGAAWTGRSRPPAGYLTKRTAEAWLRDLLHEMSRGTLPGMVQTGVTFATRPPSSCATPSMTAVVSRRRCGDIDRRSRHTCCQRSVRYRSSPSPWRASRDGS